MIFSLSLSGCYHTGVSMHKKTALSSCPNIIFSSTNYCLTLEVKENSPKVFNWTLRGLIQFVAENFYPRKYKNGQARNTFKVANLKLGECKGYIWILEVIPIFICFRSWHWSSYKGLHFCTFLFQIHPQSKNCSKFL